MSARIVYLDAMALNPGDLSYAGLEALGACSFYDYFDPTSPAQTIERARDAEIILTNKTPLDADTIARLPKLKYIGVTATGYNVVDIEAAKKRGIRVTNVPAYGTDAVAQAVFSLILEMANNTSFYVNAVRDGAWEKSQQFCLYNKDRAITELAGCKLGLIGFGNIGAAVAKIATAFDMEVLVYVRTPRTLPPSVQSASLNDLLGRSDIVSLHCPLTQETQNLINAERIARMKRGAWLINTARGPLVDEQALAEALNNGTLGGAGLDVLCVEPPKPDNPLLKAKNCLITPHIAWASRAARQRLLNVVIENVQAFLHGTQLNSVNGV